MVPGLFFGILSLVPFIFWFLWLCMQCGQRWRFKRRAAAEQAQFLTSREQQVGLRPPCRVGLAAQAALLPRSFIAQPSSPCNERPIADVPAATQCRLRMHRTGLQTHPYTPCTSVVTTQPLCTKPFC